MISKKIFTIAAIIIFAFFVTSCQSAGNTDSGSVENGSESSIQTTIAAEDIDGEDMQTTESTEAGSEKEDLKIKETNPAEGEYFVYAILKSIDAGNNTITVEQLINEPNEKEINPEVTLGQDCQVVRIVLEQATEKETITEINLSDIGINNEIGIIFKSDNTARAIIFQEIK